VTEFRGDQVFEGQFPTGKEVLIFYEIEDVNRAHDTITLVGYALFVHLCSFWSCTLDTPCSGARLNLCPPLPFHASIDSGGKLARLVQFPSPSRREGREMNVHVVCTFHS